METAWKTLEEAGVPMGAPRVRVPPEPSALRPALHEVAGRLDSLPEPEREALHAWLCAFASGWPQTFEALLGTEARALLRRLDEGVYDPGRHVKLRRVAKAHLARIF